MPTTLRNRRRSAGSKRRRKRTNTRRRQVKTSSLKATEKKHMMRMNSVSKRGKRLVFNARNKQHKKAIGGTTPYKVGQLLSLDTIIQDFGVFENNGLGIKVGKKFYASREELIRDKLDLSEREYSVTNIKNTEAFPDFKYIQEVEYEIKNKSSLFSGSKQIQIGTQDNCYSPKKQIKYICAMFYKDKDKDKDKDNDDLPGTNARDVDVILALTDEGTIQKDENIVVSSNVTARFDLPVNKKDALLGNPLEVKYLDNQNINRNVWNLKNIYINKDNVELSGVDESTPDKPNTIFFSFKGDTNKRLSAKIGGFNQDVSLKMTAKSDQDMNVMMVYFTQCGLLQGINMGEGIQKGHFS